MCQLVKRIMLGEKRKCLRRASECLGDSKKTKLKKKKARVYNPLEVFRRLLERLCELVDHQDKVIALVFDDMNRR